MRKSSEGPALSIGLFQKVQGKIIYFPYVFRKNVSELSKNCSIHGKNCEISGMYNFWTPIKSSIPDVWNWNCWTLFDWEIEVGGPWPSPPQWLRPCTCTCHIIKLNKLQKYVFQHYKAWERKLVSVCFLKKLERQNGN